MERHERLRERLRVGASAGMGETSAKRLSTNGAQESSGMIQRLFKQHYQGYCDLSSCGAGCTGRRDRPAPFLFRMASGWEPKNLSFFKLYYLFLWQITSKLNYARRGMQLRCQISCLCQQWCQILDEIINFSLLTIKIKCVLLNYE